MTEREIEPTDYEIDLIKLKNLQDDLVWWEECYEKAATEQMKKYWAGFVRHWKFKIDELKRTKDE